MTKSVMAHPTASALLKKNHNELSFFAEIEGVKVRCRPDIIREGKIIADLKTTDDASVKGFQRSVANFNYHRQAGFYCDIISQVTGEKYDTFTFIAVEKQPPYAVQVFVLDEESINKGREEYKLGIAKYRECLLTNSWPAYENVAVPLTLPGWKF
jgi:exodeoxyribonuclease VIII